MPTKHNGFRDWILGMVALLLVASAVGGVRVYARVGVLENETSNLKEDIRDIKETVHRIEHALTKR